MRKHQAPIGDFPARVNAPNKSKIGVAAHAGPKHVGMTL